MRVSEPVVGVGGKEEQRVCGLIPSMLTIATQRLSWLLLKWLLRSIWEGSRASGQARGWASHIGGIGVGGATAAGRSGRGG